MLNFGVIASGNELHSLPTPGGQTYTGSSNYVTPVFSPTSTVAPTIQNLFVVGTVATWTPTPGYAYNIVTYNADGTVAGTYVQAGDLSQLGFVSVPTGGTAVVQAVADVSNVTTYGVPTSPTLQQLGVGGTHA